MPGKRPQARPKQELNAAEAERCTVRLLARRALSQEEVRTALEARGFQPAVARNAAKSAAERGWIQDSLVATQAAEKVLRSGPAARELLESRILSRGVGPSKSRAAASEASPRSDSLNARELARQGVARLPQRLSPRQAASRILSLLARRGFDHETSAAAARAAFAEAGLDTSIFEDT